MYSGCIKLHPEYAQYHKREVLIMKKLKIYGSLQLSKFQKSSAGFDDALIKTKNEIKAHYESDSCSKEEMLKTLKNIKKYEFFVNTVIPSVCLGYITFAITYIIECLITGETNTAFDIPSLSLFWSVILILVLLAIIIIVPMLLIYKMITDTLNMCSDDYISFVMPYEKHIIIENLNKDNTELSEILKFTEFLDRK